MNLSLLHWPSAFLLLILAFNTDSKWTYSQKPEWIKRAQGHFIAKGNGSDASRFLATLATGDKSRLRKKFKRTFKLFGIYHIFTPSGLHLSAILLPFLYLLKRWPSKILKLSFIFLLLPLFWLEKFYSLKRMCLFHILRLLLPKMRYRIIFIVTFFLNFILGGWQQSQISFALSYLFFGAILFSTNKKQIFSNLFFSQMLAASFFEDYFSPLGFFIGQFLNLIFTFLFPLITLATIFPIKADLILTNSFINLIEKISIMISRTPVFLLTPVAVLFMYFCWRGRNYKSCRILSLVLLPSSSF